MKIAIYEPDPRICGPMMWAWEIRNGLRKNGHEVNVLTSTKSGRPSTMWGGEQKQSRGVKNWPHKIDHVVKHDHLIDTMDSYDLIIMPDIVNMGQDKETKKGWSSFRSTTPPTVTPFTLPDGSVDQHEIFDVVPFYIHALQTTKTRWITGLHGNLYTEAKVPYLRYLLDAPSNRSRVMYTNSPYSLDSKHPSIRENTWEPIHLPYSLKIADEDFVLPPKNTIGMTGRFIFNKGQPSLALAASMIDPQLTTEIWGACSAGLGPSPTFVTFEGMINLDPTSRRKRYGNDPEDVTGMGGNIVASYTWDFKYSTDQVVRYLGVYSQPTEVTKRLGLHLGLTVANFSGGLVEFASLEAMDAGSMSMALPNVARPEYAMSILPATDVWRGVPKQVQDIEQLRFLADQVNRYVAVTDEQRLAAALHNRATVRRLNDPSAIGERIIELAFS
uniref:Glycosyltransferase n=1 Tax=Micrococcus phage Kurnik TaxID=3092208 RepID=A0AAU6R689_9CAUD